MSNPNLFLIDSEQHRHYVDRFTALYAEDIINAIPDRAAWPWMQANIPFIECPDATIEEIYYFRGTGLSGPTPPLRP